MLRIGLTGGIGSGKSTVAALLVAEGAALIDTDAIAREVTAPGGTGVPPIAQAFGAELIASDGSLDRARMRSIVFADAVARRRLESILHPLIGQACDERAAQWQATGTRVLVFDVPLLVESQRWRSRVDRVLVIDATEPTQVARVTARSGWTPEAVHDVIAQQVSRPLRRAAADAVIYNEHLTREQLADVSRALWMRWAAAPLTR